MPIMRTIQRISGPWNSLVVIACRHVPVILFILLGLSTGGLPGLAPRGLTLLGAEPVPAQESPSPGDKGVENPRLILVTIDGLRWEEVFRGADEKFINREAGNVRDVEGLKARFWDDDLQERRQRLLPFLWNEIAMKGQLWGNQDAGCQVRVTNGRYFSYPGYHELLAGYADDRIDSNEKRHNPNITVLEWLHRQPEFAGSVRAYCSWDVFPFILNSPRSAIPVNAGWEPLPELDPEFGIAQLNEIAANLPRVWDSVRYDHFTMQGALQALRAERPHILYIALGETDDWAHEGRYDLYLDSAHRTDRYLQQLWDFVREDPDYAGRTTLLIATDHGRGNTATGWKSHGASIPGSESIWIGVLGPGIPALGVRGNVEATQSQVAATCAQLLGKDYCAAVAEAARPMDWSQP
jgi:hypothetical protein